GRPITGVEVRIVGDDGRPLPADEEGAIEVRGPVLMRRYLEEEKGAEPPLREGWLRTGDTGRLDSDRRLHPTGRRDDRIIRGGENVSPAEVEAALVEDPSVEEAVVVGVPDAEWGEVPAALIRPSGDAIDTEALSERLSGRIARFKLPARIRTSEEIPRLASGKPDRSAVRERLAAG
ncbi:MAG: AMP-binding protein, partial [Candidatus Eisenbacteria bacterium]|nr:AMP-binding protein [Candidatus Latescibacterota bacterium]MBD3303422.1 AMP-binding protein [Candidatus Eisenbacteria bacterium]